MHVATCMHCYECTSWSSYSAMYCVDMHPAVEPLSKIPWNFQVIHMYAVLAHDLPINVLHTEISFVLEVHEPDIHHTMCLQCCASPQDNGVPPKHGNSLIFTEDKHS